MKTQLMFGVFQVVNDGMRLLFSSKHQYECFEWIEKQTLPSTTYGVIEFWIVEEDGPKA